MRQWQTVEPVAVHESVERLREMHNHLLMQLQDVHKTYVMGEVEVPVLKGINIEIHKDELLVILGESGSGKSTLLNLMGGIDVATRGSIRFLGEELTEFNERALTLYRRARVGFVFQFYNLIPTLTALENVSVATEIADDPMDPREALDLVGLSDRLGHFPSQLSGGQQQRVAVARALAKRPMLMLCDEPTGALDHDTSIQVLDLLQDLNRKTETTVVMITHAAPIAELADRVATIILGRIGDLRRNEPPARAAELRW
jgi:putative ABC transport system ATP-binding protein